MEGMRERGKEGGKIGNDGGEGEIDGEKGKGQAQGGKGQPRGGRVSPGGEGSAQGGGGAQGGGSAQGGEGSAQGGVRVKPRGGEGSAEGGEGSAEGRGRSAQERGRVSPREGKGQPSAGEGKGQRSAGEGKGQRWRGEGSAQGLGRVGPGDEDGAGGNSMRALLFRNLIRFRSRSFEFNISLVQRISLRSISSASNAGNEPSFTYTYLVKSCGLSRDAAHSVAQKLNLKHSRNPNLVLALFRDEGLTETQIKRMIGKCPALLVADPSTSLKPKFEFLRRLGVSGSCLAKMVSKDPNILRRSVASHMVSSIAFLRTVLQTDEEIVLALKRSTRILVYRPDKIMPKNIEILTSHSVPMKNITKLIKLQPGVLMGVPTRLNTIVLKLKDMGFDPAKTAFIRALRVLMTINELNWEKKLEVFRSVGWSDDDILTAIKLDPFCMANSEQKIRKVMEYIVKEMGFEPSSVARRPIVLALSLEERIVPRCTVLQILQSKGLVKGSLRLFSILEMAEKKFLEKFITKCKEEAPEILKYVNTR
ncbi:hypothetical protein H6P81_002987 [Aristolochia fimbriata]|uniref:Uncharacterized protein n=1 Tax=Aristolochia fimbriata TaxID=158543 RepID=A0AAV7FD03_ARIFI|nr:hypothetical protein H6P81_002987 [Aristolochia fimbriata]